jgi:hydroxypyruvate isomerase
MPVVAANLTFLWTELPVLERFAAAARARFKRVEILLVDELAPGALEQALREHRLELIFIDPRAGNWAGGDQGMLSIPAREEEFCQSMQEALANAKRYGTQQLNVLAGILPTGADRVAAFATGLKTLQHAEPLFA